MLRLGAVPGRGAAALDAVACPVLVLHGRRDRLVPVAYAEAVLRAHPTWSGRIFPDLGHVPQMEAPDRWLAAVEDWSAGLD
jgi:pimeloyl-ACP methyl ester carboxylesterase